jgi:hypothetical protein
MGVPIKTFRCPSRGEQRVFPVPLTNFGTTYPGNANDVILMVPGQGTNLNVSQTDYAANGGSTMGAADGAFMNILPGANGAPAFNSRMRTLESISDGPSNVVFLGEKLFNKLFKATPSAGDTHGYASSINAGNVRWCTSGSPNFTPIRPEPDIRDPNAGVGTLNFGTAHPAKCLFVFGDGHVTGVSTSVDARVFANLCLSTNGVSPGEDEYD